VFGVRERRTTHAGDDALLLVLLFGGMFACRALYTSDGMRGPAAACAADICAGAIIVVPAALDTADGSAVESIADDWTRSDRLHRAPSYVRSCWKEDTAALAESTMMSSS